MEAAKKACIHEFVMSLPRATRHLSGERWSLADKAEAGPSRRAILKDAPSSFSTMTSNVDLVNVRFAQRAVSLAQNQNSACGGTPSGTIRSADQIIVMQWEPFSGAPTSSFSRRTQATTNPFGSREGRQRLCAGPRQGYLILERAAKSSAADLFMKASSCPDREEVMENQ